MQIRGIHNLLVITFFATAAVSARAEFESASQAYRNNDYYAAFQEFLSLAKNGDPKAQTIIAMMYKYGESVEQDYGQAVKWYLSAAEQGYPSAQHSLAELYESGKGVDQDPDKASYWLTLSTQQESQYSSRNGKVNKSDPASLHYPRNWSRDWNFTLPEKIQSDPDVYGSVSPPNNTGIYWVQLGAMKSSASAQQLWIKTSEPNQDLFQELQPHIKNSNSKPGSLFRLRTGPFDSIEKARHFCDALSARGIKTGCLAIKSVEG